MKLKISYKKTALTFLFSTLFCGVLIFLVCISIFLDTPWDWRQPVIITVWLISAIIFYVWTITSNYYELTKKYVKVIRYKKEYIYYFNEIIYIDVEKSRKRKTITFVTSRGDVKYLNFDQKNILLDALIEGCHNLLEKEELMRKFPNIKF